MGTELVKTVRASELANLGLVKAQIDAEKAAEQRAEWEMGTARERRVAVAYRAVEEGRQMIDLEASLQKAGVDFFGRPTIAICPAQRHRVRLETWNETGRVQYRSRLWTYNTEMAGVNGSDVGEIGFATAPLMPPHIRKIAQRGDLLFWEAQWHSTRVKREIVIDPALLEPVVGSLYVVKAAWELTDLEAAALR